MSLFNNPNDILLLKNLLNPKQDSDESDTEVQETKTDKTPSNISNIKQNLPIKKSPYDPLPQKAEPKVQSIEQWQELQEQNDAEVLETREQPEYNITYRQKIGTEDIFLQLGNRTGATASCEDMLLEISLPNDTTSIDKMGLKITETEIELSTNKHYLKLPLVHEVDVDRCHAAYDSTKSKLVLTLRLIRELDFVNF